MYTDGDATGRGSLKRLGLIARATAFACVPKTRGQTVTLQQLSRAAAAAARALAYLSTVRVSGDLCRRRVYSARVGDGGRLFFIFLIPAKTDSGATLLCRAWACG